ncbi:xanthine dehydrogenase/oxidase-like [Anopheles marshallii]|uniref:xanthine dehydrogenase/oxidase-like n=1 Tax=Anopheles marshallii TaxID=1521116 RepID=UPI00237BD775|nr:xanthine dehydrogenase/oxidase-like [Anopheles marshallii]
MCREGGCGACVVNVSGLHPVTKETKSWSVNSCLFPVFACHGLDIKTVESLGNRKDGYHPIQERLAHMNGSQCGFCSPGMVMTMYSLMESKQGKVSMEEVENQLGGNICRCTGYRPILDAFKSLASVSQQELSDIEELQICPKTNTVCSAQCPVVACNVDKARSVRIAFDDGKEWYKVFSVRDIFATLTAIGSKLYMLHGGNTAHGVYRRNEAIQIFIDVNSVEELRSHYQNSDRLIVGGNVTLAELIEILRTAAKKLSAFSYCEEMEKHLLLAANPAVRNVGSIAGNLSIKNQHPEFPSDLYILLEAIGAKLTVAESVTTQSEVSPLQYIRMDMTKKLLKTVSLPAIVNQTNVFRSYRVAQRAQNAHAYVNAAFLLQFANDKSTVTLATLCFGGINPMFTHATRTEKLLVGKRLFDNNTIQQAINTLASEIQPDWILPDASAEYRRNLAVSLFYKFILSVATDNNVPLDPRFKSGSTMLERPLSSGQQNYDTNKKNWPVSKYVPKLEGLAQASGEAKYTNDFPPFPGELHAAFVVATQPNTTIGKIDPTDALRLPGVVAFYSASDIPGTNSFVANDMLMPFPDVEEIFCSGRVLFHGQPVGVIVAEHLDQAVRASKQVMIIYERVTDEPVCPTVKTMLNNNIDKEVEDHLKHMNFLPIDDQSVQQIQGTIEMYGQYHFYIEPQTCLCVPIEDGMDIYAATQWIDLCQVAIAAALKVPQNSLNFTIRRLGGSYGGKLTRAGQIAGACALAALLTKRPVRFVMTMESNVETIGKRCGCFSSYQVNVDNEGNIKQLSNNFLQDYGSSRNDDVLTFTNDAFNLSYNSSTWTFKGKPILTDAPSNTFARAPGITEGIAMAETIMEHIAWVTGVDPMQVRMRNMHTGSKFQILMPQFRQDVQYDKRKQTIDEFNAKNRWRKRGIAMVPMQYPLVYYSALHAQVSIYAKDGTVSISHGGIEVGQGINTKAAQVAAFTLGIPLEKISIKPTNSMTSPNATMTGGSMTSEAVCYAVIKACEILNTRLKPIKDELKNAPWEKVTQTCYSRDIDLSVLYQYKKADLKPYSIWGLGCAEIEVDVLTGAVQLTRVDILEDTGESLSPGIDVGQIEGAFVMGIGYWLTESLVYDMTNGALLTNRSWNYKPPGAKDIPVDFRIQLIQTGDNRAGVLRSKATGEPAMSMSVVVVFALRYALRSAQKDAGRPDDWISLGSASTPEQIFLKASNTFEQYNLN